MFQQLTCESRQPTLLAPPSHAFAAGGSARSCEAEDRRRGKLLTRQRGERRRSTLCGCAALSARLASAVRRRQSCRVWTWRSSAVAHRRRRRDSRTPGSSSFGTLDHDTEADGMKLCRFEQWRRNATAFSVVQVQGEALRRRTGRRTRRTALPVRVEMRPARSVSVDRCLSPCFSIG